MHMLQLDGSAVPTVVSEDEWPLVTQFHSADGAWRGFILHGPGATSHSDTYTFQVDTSGILHIAPPLGGQIGQVFNSRFVEHGYYVDTLSDATYAIAWRSHDHGV